MSIFYYIIVFTVTMVIFGIKNEITCSIRNKFIWDGSGNYDLLPSYNRMFFTPHLWTYKQWGKWIERKA